VHTVPTGGGGVLSRYKLRGPGGPEGSPGSAVFRVFFFSFSVVRLFADCTN